jgi:RNA polymerase sigma factor (sigma-70 family)
MNHGGVGRSQKIFYFHSSVFPLNRIYIDMAIPKNSMELQELVNEAKKGSRGAQEALFHRLADRCLSLCIRYVKNEPDAQERRSDGFYKFFRSLPNFHYESDEALYRYINTIMVNECISQLRKKRVFHIVAEPLDSDAVLDEDILDRLSAAEIHALISKLPVGARTIFNLNVMDGCRHEEIARMLGITASASRAQLTRARCLLQLSISHLKKADEQQGSK